MEFLTEKVYINSKKGVINSWASLIEYLRLLYYTMYNTDKPFKANYFWQQCSPAPCIAVWSEHSISGIPIWEELVIAEGPSGYGFLKKYSL